jgi:GST-like protein
MDLYAFPTPNGYKISIALEEMGLSYNYHRVDIRSGDQFKPEFLNINPNSKIPALVDGDLAIFESVAILIYLAEKTGKFLPKDTKGRYATLQWCLFQAAGLGPMFGQTGHFKVYAPEKVPYAIERYSKESVRILGVVDQQLSKNRYLAGDDYTIADMATWPWVNTYINYYKESLDPVAHANVLRWFKEIGERPAVQRGLKALL